MRARTILITGCSSGIGLASAKALKARGWRVLATARQTHDMQRLEQEVGVEAIFLELSQPASVEACVDTAITLTGGQIDALFNNAAYAQAGAIEDLSADLLRRQMEVNVVGAHELTRRVLPLMRQRNSGRIVQCSSVLGLVSARFRGAYCASKFALEALTDSLRMELSDTDIKVSLIEPGPIRTNFIASALENFKATVDIDGSPYREFYQARLAEMERGGQQAFKLEPDAVVEKLIHAVESPRPKPRYFVTTPTYVTDAFRRVLPTRLLDRYLVLG